MLELPTEISDWLGDNLMTLNNEGDPESLHYFIISPREMMQKIKSGDLASAMQDVQEKYPIRTKLFFQNCLYAISKKEIDLSRGLCAGCGCENIDAQFEESDAFSFGQVELLARIEFQCVECKLVWGAITEI